MLRILEARTLGGISRGPQRWQRAAVGAVLGTLQSVFVRGVGVVAHVEPVRVRDTGLALLSGPAGSAGGYVQLTPARHALYHVPGVICSRRRT
jgi:hypothetical protein